MIVPEQLTQLKVQDNQGNITFKRRFDVEQNVYMQVGAGNMDSGSIVDLTTPIRSSDYISAISEGLKLFEMQIGYLVACLPLMVKELRQQQRL